MADGIARIHGLEKAMQGELLEFPGDVYGMVLNLEEDNVGAVLLGDSKSVSEGDTVKTTGRVVEVPVGDALTGRVVNALGQPIDGKGPIATDKYRQIGLKIAYYRKLRGLTQEELRERLTTLLKKQEISKLKAPWRRIIKNEKKTDQ